MTIENSLIARIDADLQQAMRDKNSTVKLALRAVKTALTEASKATPDQSMGNESMTDEQVQAVIQKEAKRRRDAAAEYVKHGAAERAEAERAELTVLEQYLPQQLDEHEIEAIVRVVIDELGATSMREMGSVMSATMPRVAGLADGKAVSQVVRRLLG